MSIDPFKDSTEKDERRSEMFAIDLGLVVGVPTNEDGEYTRDHQVIVRVLSPETEPLSSPEPIDVPVDVRGDVGLPSENSLVLIGYARGRKPIVLKTLYSREDDVRDHEQGDRVVGHGATLSSLKIDKDGTIEIVADQDGTQTKIVLDDGDVIINDGNTQPVTDVSTTKDGDGHVTDVSLTRATDLYVNE